MIPKRISSSSLGSFYSFPCLSNDLWLQSPFAIIRFNNAVLNLTCNIRKCLESWETPQSTGVEKQLLLEQADALEASPDYELRYHFAWGQESLPYRNSATYTVVENDARGYIKVYADQLLFANIDIDYKGFRLFEKRRLKLNEKHYFDHPKFGVLIQVSRLEPVTEELLLDQDNQDNQDGP